MTVLQPSDIDAFRHEGWFVVPDVFTPAECDEIVGHVERAAFELALGRPDDGQLSYRPMMHLASPELERVATDARWAPIVRPLLGAQNGARLYWEQAVAKPPFARSALSNKLLDDRLLVAAPDGWLDVPVREREFDLVAVLANYDNG